MSNIRKWSQSATGNATVAGGVNTINWAEGQLPSTVNNSAREMMAQVRSIYIPSKWGWIEHSNTASVASQTAFKLTGNQTSDYTAGRRWRLQSGSSTRYGSIVSSSFTTETTVTVTVDSGSLSSSHTLVSVSSIDANHIPTSYMTSASLATALGTYVTSNSLSAALATYVTSNSMSAALATFITSNSVSAAIAAISVTGLTLLATLTTTSGATQPVTSIPSTYQRLYIEVAGVSFSGAGTLTLAVSDDNGSNYGTAGSISAASGGAANALYGVINVSNLQATDTYVSAVSHTHTAAAGAAGTVASTMLAENGGGFGPINAIRFGITAGTFDAGTIRVYGVK